MLELEKDILLRLWEYPNPDKEKEMHPLSHKYQKDHDKYRKFLLLTQVPRKGRVQPHSLFKETQKHYKKEQNWKIKKANKTHYKRIETLTQNPKQQA